MPGEIKWQLNDIGTPQNHNIVSKENGIVNKYIDLTNVIRAEHEVKVKAEDYRAFDSLSKRHIDVICVSNVIVSAQISTITKSPPLRNLYHYEISTITSTTRILRDVCSLQDQGLI